MNPITPGLKHYFYHVVEPSKWLGKMVGWPGNVLEAVWEFWRLFRVLFGMKLCYTVSRNKIGDKNRLWPRFMAHE